MTRPSVPDGTPYRLPLYDMLFCTDVGIWPQPSHASTLSLPTRSSIDLIYPASANSPTQMALAAMVSVNSFAAALLVAFELPFLPRQPAPVATTTAKAANVRTARRVRAMLRCIVSLPVIAVSWDPSTTILPRQLRPSIGRRPSRRGSAWPGGGCP